MIVKRAHRLALIGDVPKVASLSSVWRWLVFLSRLFAGCTVVGLCNHLEFAEFGSLEPVALLATVSANQRRSSAHPLCRLRLLLFKQLLSTRKYDFTLMIIISLDIEVYLNCSSFPISSFKFGLCLLSLPVHSSEAPIERESILPIAIELG